MRIRKVRDQHKTACQQFCFFFNNLKAIGTSVTKKTVGNRLNNGLKSCSTDYNILKMKHVQAHFKFASEDLNDYAREKMLRSDETKVELFGITLICTVQKMKKCEFDLKNTILTNKQEW